MERGIVGAWIVGLAVGAFAVLPASAAADSSGIEHFNLAAGPYKVIPGANLILDQINNVPKPHEDGFMIGMKPNLFYALPNGKCCGKAPPTQVVHLHHAVWLSNGTSGQGQGQGNVYGGLYPFMAAGEEKTAIEFPKGYGYPIGAKDTWVLNYMIHNLTAKARTVYITYDMDFLPATAPLASTITPVHPIWMDVMNHHIYPVFDVKRGSGRKGKFTFPDQAKDPYGNLPPLNTFTIDHPGTLIGTAGHVHPGGLYDELDMIRPGVKPTGGAIAGPVPDSVRLFRSNAVYWDPGHQPVSWDVSMKATAADWRPQVQQGDVLRVSATYDSKLASWYEVMGIMVVWEAWGGQNGVNPFTQRLDQRGHVTHRHLRENSYYGGTRSVGVNPNSLSACRTNQVIIAGFKYIPAVRGNPNCVPTVKPGRSITFTNGDANPMGTFSPINPNPFYLASVFHSVTTCKYPCGLNYGISYPLANGPGNLDSHQLAVGLPGVGTLKWSTPKNLPPGTYTFFCRIHPWMRGVFRIGR
jgi:plastocyanin